MTLTPAHVPTTGPWWGLGLLAALVALATALLFLWRHDALRDAADASRHAWFAFAMRVQFLVAAACFVLPAVTWMAAPGRTIAAALPGLARFAPSLGAALFFLVPFGLALAAVAVSSDVERRLRPGGPVLRDQVANALTAFVLAVLPVAGLMAAGAALSSGHLRIAITCAFAGVLTSLWLVNLRAGMFGPTPEAATAGPLRDRVFALAAAAKVRVRQVYVLSSRRMKLANAFAVRGGNVMLTANLLDELSKREVEAVVAHELAHLRYGHPQKLGVAFVVPFISVQMISWFVRPAAGMPLAFALGGILGWISLRWWSRRFEFQADRGAVELTNDAAALVTALARICELNAVPADWSRNLEWWMTHPSLRRRAESLAAAGHLPAGDIDGLLTGGRPAAEHWPLPAAAQEPVFGSAAKRSRAAATAWSLLAAAAVAPALLLAVLRWAGVHGAWPLEGALAMLVAFSAALVTIDLLATAGYAAWERELAERRGRTPGIGHWVGLAPGADGSTYEGFADWDLGHLGLDPVSLRYEGERARFALERAAIVGVELVPGLPGWLPAPRVSVRWRAADGTEHAFSIRDARSRALHEIPRDTLRLLDELRQWYAEGAPAGIRALGAGDPPRGNTVTGTSLAEMAAPRTLVPAGAVAAGLALLAALAVGLPLGMEVLEVMGAALAAVVALRVPVWRASRRGTPTARRGAPRAA